MSAVLEILKLFINMVWKCILSLKLYYFNFIVDFSDFMRSHSIGPLLIILL